MSEFKPSPLYSYVLITFLVLLTGLPGSSQAIEIETENKLDQAKMESCYKQFTEDHSTVVSNYVKRSIYLTKSSQPVLKPVLTTTLTHATRQTCADIFKILHSSAASAFNTPGTPNLFPPEYYEFLMDEKTIEIVRNLLEHSEPTVAPSASTSIPTPTATSTSLLPTASPTPAPGYEAPPPTTAKPKVTFTDDQVKGFIFNLSHYLVSFLANSFTFCNSFNIPFVDEDAESFGCRAITAKFFIENLKSSDGKLLVYTWYPSPTSEAELNAWLKRNVSDDYMVPPIVAVFQDVELNRTLNTRYLGGLVGIPDLRKGEFDPTKPFGDAAPVIKSTGEFQTACETFTPKTYREVNCSSVANTQGNAESGNALVSLSANRVSGVNFEASLAPVTLSYTVKDAAEGTADFKETFPAAVVMGTGPYSGNYEASLLLNSHMKVKYRSEVTRELGEFFLKYELNDNEAPNHNYDVYAFSLYKWVNEYIISQNTVSLERCDLMSFLYQSPVHGGDLKIVSSNVIQNFDGQECTHLTPSPAPSPAPVLVQPQQADAPSGAAKTTVYLIIISVLTFLSSIVPYIL